MLCWILLAEPGVLRLPPAQHELVVLDLARLAQVHGPGPQRGGAQGDLLHRELLLRGQPDVLGQHPVLCNAMSHPHHQPPTFVFWSCTDSGPSHNITSHGGRAWHTRLAHTTDTMQSACVNKWKYGNQWTSAHLKLAKWKSKVVRRELCRSPAARTLMKAKQLITAETLLRILRNKREMSSSILYSNLSRHGGEG